MKTKTEKEQEKKKADEEACAKAYEEFYNTFVEVPDTKSKVWVKAGTYDAGSNKEDTKEKGKLYKPTSKFSEAIKEKFKAEKTQNIPAPKLFDRPDKPGKKKEVAKKKSNLELFKEELKVIQEERAERHRIKNSYFREPQRSSTRFESPPRAIPIPKDIIAIDDGQGITAYDSGDPNSTNIYLGNLNPKTTEHRLMELFGRFGPLASVKIMWPRTEDERVRGRNCGFVAYMNRTDGDRAINALGGKLIDNFEMKLGWGKSVPIPPHPIYIPPALVQLTLPPPPSGLPFNCQPRKSDLDKVPPPGAPLPTNPNEIAEMEKVLKRAVVKVVIPTERSLLQLIHRMIEFVINEGPMFEAMIMSREINNLHFRFLFENQSPAHVYYRWKLFTLLQGESQIKWSLKPFRMFRNGSIWKPPPLNAYSLGMPEELINTADLIDESCKKGSLSQAQRKRLESMIRKLTPEKLSVGELMVWCVEHAESAQEICQCILESISNNETPFPKKIARLYLISDILHNCSQKISNAFFFRTYLEDKLPAMIKGLHNGYTSIESRIKAEVVKQRVMKCFRAWEDWAVYSPDYLIKLQNIFLGLETMVKKEEEPVEPILPGDVTPKHPSTREDIDGIPLDDLDGFPMAGDTSNLNGGSLLKKSAGISALQGYDDDGSDSQEDIDGLPISRKDSTGDDSKQELKPGFVSSKWESVSPSRVEKQAMTLSKWDELVEQKGKLDKNNAESDTTPVYDNHSPEDTNKYDVAAEEDIDGVPMDESYYGDYKRKTYQSSDEEYSSQPSSRRSPRDRSNERTPLAGQDSEERRAKLRAIEVKVLQYQDELERGIRQVKTGYTLHSQVKHYRHKLTRKVMRTEDRSSSAERSTKPRRRRGSRSSSEEKDSRRRKRSRSPHKSHSARKASPRRHRSRSPRRRKKSKSNSPRKHKKKSRR